MIPVSVRLRGFMSYREPQELLFDDDRLWVLEGPNGVGKSTIFDAITFTLFGHHRLGKQHHQDLINHDSDGMEVELVLRLEDETYKLSRTVPRKGHPTCQIWRRAADGRFVPVTGTEQREPYHAWVEERLGLDYDAFTASVLLLQGESEKLIQSAPEGRRKLLAKLIDLSRYERLHDGAKRRADDHRKEAARLQQRLGALREIGQADVDAAAAALDATERARGALDHEVEELCELLPAAEQRERLLAEQAEVSRRRDAQHEIPARAAEVRERTAEILALEPAGDEAAGHALADARRAFKARQTEVSQARAEQNLVVARLRDLDRLTGDMAGEAVPCSLCGQEVTAAHAETERARLAEKRDRLAGAVDAADRALVDAEGTLLRAQQAHEAARRLVEIARQLDEVPAAARRGVAELTGALAEKRAAREEAKVRRDDQAAELARLRTELRERTDTEEARAAAAREEHLYGILAGLLGPEELQRRLVRDAEQAIVELANLELAGLTQGRLRLALRPGKDGEDAAQKALDLLVHNQETCGEHPTALGLSSGSQKFRIAISLALAIGRYLARETRRVESVIIDEGFGCLDRASREDAVAVLSELGGHLSRVILVSHQEEFSARFKSGYRIDLVDRTSVPTRVSR